MKKTLILIWSVTAFVLFSTAVISARSLDCQGGVSGNPFAHFLHLVINADGTVNNVDASSYFPSRVIIKENNKNTAHIEVMTNVGGNGYIQVYKHIVKIDKKHQQMNIIQTSYYKSGYTKTHRYNGYCNYLSKKPLVKTIKPAEPTNLEIEFKKYTFKDRKRIQIILKQKGFYFASIDGLWGKGTLSAF